MNLDPRQMMAEKIIKNTDLAATLSRLIAGLETEILAEVEALQDALDVDHIEEVPDPEERQAALTRLTEAQVKGDLHGFYVEEILADRLDNPDRAKDYLELDAEEWLARIEGWADRYREAGASEEIPDRRLAEQHVREVWGVDIEEFETNVVEFDGSDLMRRVLAGNMRTARDGIRLCREEVEKDQANE